MATKSSLFGLLLLLVCSLSTINKAAAITCKAQPPFRCNITAAFNSTVFGSDFIFGGATSAYQIEGAAGRGLNIWDTFTHRYPEKSSDGQNGDVATNSSYLYKEDVALLKNMGVKGYRFSIAWSRVLPRGRPSRGVNEKGVQYYNNLINELKANGIEPFVTIFHWDLPQSLDDEYRGFLSPKIVDDYKSFAELCFQRFGDRVKHWITLNQPYTHAIRGHGSGADAPGRCSNRSQCDEGDSATEPYWVTHHQLLAHARVVELYRNNYQLYQGGQIGTTLITRGFLPYNESSPTDQAAAQRGRDFFLGWYMDPLTFGDYPQVMKDIVGMRLPKFTAEESRLVKGSFDFLGLNYYLTQYTKDDPTIYIPPSAITDPHVKNSYDRNGVLIGPKAANFYYYPKGMEDMLDYVRVKYNNPIVYITENGFSDDGNAPLATLLNDYPRVDYLCSHLCFLRSAMENGSNVKGYFPWSSQDNYEFNYGFTIRFGLNYVDFEHLEIRTPKRSAKWYARFIGTNLKRIRRPAAKTI